MKKFLFMLVAVVATCETMALAADTINVWPGLAPGETTQSLGQSEPARPGEVPTVTRITGVSQPTLDVFLPAHPNGTAVVILPGGGFVKIVPDKEGSEAAQWLNQLGVTAFVLNYRTKNEPAQVGWKRPLQDAQRAIALVRSQAGAYHLNKDKIGLLGFSAGGQIAARLLATDGKLAYDGTDAIASTSSQPDFALLIYPWNIYDNKTGDFIEGVNVPKTCPPTFLVHTHDDRSSSLGAVYFYAELKKRGIASELHVYGNGGHGYGMREVKDSQISTWPMHASNWLQVNGYAD